MAVPRRLLRWLDNGSDAVSVHYAGLGHGSGSSVCATLLFMAAFLAFLALFGVFSAQSVLASFDMRRSDSFSYSFASNELLLATDENATLLISLLDGNYRTLNNLTLTNPNDPNCLANLSPDQITQVTSYAYYYCLPDNITLTQSSNPS